MPADTTETVAEQSARLQPSIKLTCSSYSFYVQLLWYPMYYPGGMKARVSPVQWSKPYSIFATTQDSNPGGRIQNHKRWPLHYHCTPFQYNLISNPRRSLFSRFLRGGESSNPAQKYGKKSGNKEMKVNIEVMNWTHHQVTKLKF